MQKLVLLILLLVTTNIQASPNDFSSSSDGISDLVLYEKGENQLRWKIFQSGDAFAKIQTLGGFGDEKATPVPGNYTQAGASVRAVIKANEKKLRWNLENVDGSFILNQPANSLITGFDFDANQIFDFASRTKAGNFKVWLNPFLSQAGDISNNHIDLNFPVKARKKGVVLALNLNGVDSIAYLYATKKQIERKRGVKIISKTLSGVESQFNLNKIKIRNYKEVLPIKGEDGLSRLLFVWKGKDRYSFDVRDFSGKQLYRGSLKAEAKQIVIGNFLLTAGEEFAVKTSAGIIILNPFSNQQKFVEYKGNDTLIDHINFSVNEKSFLKREDTLGVGIDSVCESKSGLSSGVLWKPESEVEDNRGGKPVALFQGSYKPNSEAIKIYATNGEEVTVFGFRPFDEEGINGDSDPYYSGWSPGEGLSGSQIASKAKSLSGDSKVYFQGAGGKCWGPVSPTARTGSLY